VISVVISTFERPDLIRPCIERILVGTELPEEVLVVDQSRGEQTRRVIDSLDSDIVRYERHSPPSVSGSRNRGVELAREEYVAIVDDDCEMTPDWLQRVLKELERFDRPDALFGEARHPAPGVDRKALEMSVFTVEDGPREWTFPAHPASIGYGCHMVLRRAAFLELGGFDELLGVGAPLPGAEDMDYNYRLLKNGYRAISTPAIWVIHHQVRSQAEVPREVYGRNFGFSAFCAKHIRQGDRYPWRLFLRQVLGDAKMLASAVRRRSPVRARAAAWRALGTWVGLVRGWLVYGSGPR
jgi:GT2 family glycosyltransferase